jgi:hypothetical protein
MALEPIKYALNQGIKCLGRELKIAVACFVDLIKQLQIQYLILICF